MEYAFALCNKQVLELKEQFIIYSKKVSTIINFKSHINVQYIFAIDQDSEAI